MKNILDAPFVKGMMKTTANMYRLGWDERNGGNISMMLDPDEVAEYLDINAPIRSIAMGFDAKVLVGKIFIVTGTGKYFKNVEDDPENNLGIIKVAEDGTTAELLWGYSDGGRPTSELPAHLMSHISRLEKNPENRVIMHSHPTNTLAMTYVHELDEKSSPIRFGRCAPSAWSSSPTASACCLDGLRHQRDRHCDRREDEGIPPCRLGSARHLRLRQGS